MPTLPSCQTLESLATPPPLKADRSAIICHFSPLPCGPSKNLLCFQLWMDLTTYLPVPLSFGCKVQQNKIIYPHALGHFKSYNLYFIWSLALLMSLLYFQGQFSLFPGMVFKLSPTPSRFPAVSQLLSNSMEERGATEPPHHTYKQTCVYLPFCRFAFYNVECPGRPLPPLLELHFIMYTCSLLIFNLSWSTGSFHSK